MSEKFNLSWKDFQSNVSQSLSTLREEEDFFDVTLVSDDLQQFPAHKVVLSSCSPVWKNLLRSSKHSHPMLYIRGVKNMELKYILDFAYSGEVTIHQEHLDGFLAIAEDLKLKGLSNARVEDKPNIQDKHPYGISDVNSANIASKTLERNLIPLEEVTKIDEERNNADFNETKYRPNEHMDTNDYEATIASMMEKVNNLWYCKVCGKEYTSKHKINLKEHIETHHTNGFTHTCDICQKACGSRKYLRMHRSKHLQKSM